MSYFIIVFKVKKINCLRQKLCLSFCDIKFICDYFQLTIHLFNSKGKKSSRKSIKYTFVFDPSTYRIPMSEDAKLFQLKKVEVYRSYKSYLR